MTERDREEAKRLREAGDHAGALALFLPIWEREHQPWDGWGAAFCLRRLGRIDEAIEVCRAVVRLHSDHQPTRSLAAWCLRDRVRRGGQSGSQIAATIDSIERVLRPTPDGNYAHPSAYVRAILDASKHLEAAGDWATSAGLLMRLEAGRLERTPGHSGDTEFHSDFEQWALRLTKSLDRTQRWDELSDAAATALAAGIRFHDGQELWVRFRQAKALHGLGRDREAWASLERIGQAHVAVDSLRADVLVALGEPMKAKVLYAQALLAATDLGPMVNVLDRVADLLGADDADAQRHRQLALSVRAERGWGTNGAPATDESVEQRRAELVGVWRGWLPEASCLTGVIKTILPNGVAGFIRGDDGQDYYFPTKELRGDAKVGTRVEFEPYERWDAKKERMSPAARSVRPT